MTPVLVLSFVLGLTALLFLYLLAIGKFHDRVQADNHRFKRRFLGTALAMLALWRLGYTFFERRHDVMLLRRVEPVYPPLAKQAHVQGKVRFEAVINVSGRVEKLTLISGQPLLIAAAKDAIFQWQYSHPVSSVRTVIEVNFVLRPTP